MFPYLILFGFFGAGAIAAGTRPHGFYRRAFVIAWLVLVVTIGLRYRVGCDWPAYEFLLTQATASVGSAVRITDPAYGLINWVAGSLGFGLWAVDIACAAIFTSGLVIFARAQPNPPLAMLVAVPYLIIVVAMGYTRQSAALGLIMSAIPRYERGEMAGVLVRLVAASAFHLTAVVVVPFFAIGIARDRILTFVLIAVSAVAAYFAFVEPSLGRLVTNYVDYRYSSAGALFRVLMNVIPGLIFIGFRKRFTTSKRERSFWVSISAASLLALLLLYLGIPSTVIDRLALYAIPLQVFVWSRLPTIFGSATGQSMPLIVAVMLYSLTVEAVWLTQGHFSECWVPYRSYLWR
ncbi:MAG TPA: EpsG family protein [Sphingomicrobium sp.]|nr:EpsG family protein [Sphingomicrobium sp.]